jgi:hypothetical protein
LSETVLLCATLCFHGGKKEDFTALGDGYHWFGGTAEKFAYNWLSA